MPDPAEMPGPDDPGSGGGGGGTHPIRIPREIPQELPAFVTRSLASEIILVRNRLNAIENAAILSRLSGGAAGIIGGPNELPNPDDPGGGGIGGGSFPGEIPREIPQELPVDFSQIETVIEGRISALRAEIAGQLEQIRAEIKQQRG